MLIRSGLRLKLKKARFTLDVICTPSLGRATSNLDVARPSGKPSGGLLEEYPAPQEYLLFSHSPPAPSRFA